MKHYTLTRLFGARAADRIEAAMAAFARADTVTDCERLQMVFYKLHTELDHGSHLAVVTYYCVPEA